MRKTEERNEETKDGKKYATVRKYSNIRAKASLQSDIVRTVTAGQSFEIIGEQGDFFQLPIGFILKELVRVDDEPNDAFLFTKRAGRVE